MPMLIHNINFYLYEKKRDILVLCVKNPNYRGIAYLEDEESKQVAEEQLAWFSSRGINSAKTNPEDTLEGWLGWYYIDVDPTHDMIGEYTKTFENEDGSSLRPKYYQMSVIDYSIWVNEGRIARHEQLLEDLKNGTYNP